MKWALWCCQCFQGPEKTRSVSPFDSSWRPLFGPFRPLQPLKPFELDHTKSHHCRLSQHAKRQSGKVTSQAVHSHLVHTSKPNVFRKHMKAWQMSFPGGLADFGPSAAADAMWMWYPSGPGILIKHVQIRHPNSPYINFSSSPGTSREEASKGMSRLIDWSLCIFCEWFKRRWLG